MMKKFILSIFASVAMTAIAQNEIVIGDMNEDGEITVSDITALTEVAMEKAPKRTVNYCTEDFAVEIAKLYANQVMEAVQANKAETERLRNQIDDLKAMIDYLEYKIWDLESRLSNSRDKNDAETTWDETDEAGKECTK